MGQEPATWRDDTWIRRLVSSPWVEGDKSPSAHLDPPLPLSAALGWGMTGPL